MRGSILKLSLVWVCFLILMTNNAWASEAFYPFELMSINFRLKGSRIPRDVVHLSLVEGSSVALEVPMTDYREYYGTRKKNTLTLPNNFRQMKIYVGENEPLGTWFLPVHEDDFSEYVSKFDGMDCTLLVVLGVSSSGHYQVKLYNYSERKAKEVRATCYKNISDAPADARRIYHIYRAMFSRYVGADLFLNEEQGWERHSKIASYYHSYYRSDLLPFKPVLKFYLEGNNEKKQIVLVEGASPDTLYFTTQAEIQKAERILMVGRELLQIVSFRGAFYMEFEEARDVTKPQLENRKIRN